jgi:hypothetical protein
MPVDVETPPSKEEQSHRQSGLSGWMAGLKEALPNPSLGGTNDPPAEPPAESEEPVTEPSTKPVESATKPTESDTKPAEAATAPAAPAEEKWPRSAKEWKNFTTARKVKDEEYQKQIADRDAKIKDLETKASAPVSPEVQKEIESLKQENEAFSKQLRLVAVTTHPRFKNYFQSKVDATLARLKGCVSPDRLEEVSKLVTDSDSDSRTDRINELLSEMSPFQQGRLHGVLNGLAEIQVEKEAEVIRADQDYDQIKAQQKTQQEAQQAQMGKLLEDTIKSMQDAKGGRPDYQLREGETEWNAAVQKRLDAGRKLIAGNLPAEVMFRAAFDAAAYPDVLAGYKAALVDVDKLQKQIAAMSAATPKLEGTKRAETNGTGTLPTLPKDSRPMDMTKNWVKRFGEAMQGTAE